MQMKKLLVIGLALCLLLSGCTVMRDKDDADTGDGGTPPVSNQIALDAAEERADYYEALASKLEDEILSVRTELFVSRVEYEAQIEELEEKLADALAQKDQGSAENPTVPPDTNGTDAGGAESNPNESMGGETPDLDPYENFRFTVEGGRATLTAYEGRATSVTVPTAYQGYPVVAIGDRAFENKTRLQSVVIPSGVETVGWFAFSGCVALKDVTLPESVRSISYGAFLNCSSAMVIRCSAGSYAEQYAQSYGIGTQK